MKMRLQSVALLLFVCALASCDKEVLENTSVITAKNVLEVEQELFDTVNEHRVSLGLNALEYSEVAYTYANEHNEYMISKASISHGNFSSRASNISTQVNAEYVAENVAKDYDDATKAFQGWMNSINHKKTIEGEFSHTAVSVKKNTDDILYFTQVFYR